MTVHQADNTSPLIQMAEAITYRRPLDRVRVAHLKAAAVLAALTLVGVALWLGLAAIALRAAGSLVNWITDRGPAEIYIGLMVPIAFAIGFALFEQAHERENKVYFDVR